jgi:hypothetical protein
MKNPTIRVTKWLGDIPVEAGCSACPAVVFRAKGSGHPPNREEFQKSIQAQFDKHRKTAHSLSGSESAKKSRASSGERNMPRSHAPAEF